MAAFDLEHGLLILEDLGKRVFAVEIDGARADQSELWRAAVDVLIDKLTTTRQFSCFPTCPQYCRVTPTEWVPFFTKPVSSTTQASTGACFCMAGSA